MKEKFLVISVMLFLFVLACSQKEESSAGIIKDVIEIKNRVKAFPKLSDYKAFVGDLHDMQPAKGVFLYDLNAELFSDYAYKKRFISLPDGKSMTYHGEKAFDFPDGARIFKFFYYPVDMRKDDGAYRIIETRVLEKIEGNWQAYSYIWDSLQNDASLIVAGEHTTVSWMDKNGNSQKINYSIPNMIQCKSCHEYDGEIVPIGPAARHVNKTSPIHPDYAQIEDWKQKGYITDVPIQKDVPYIYSYKDQSISLDDRARSYLDINCAHCHNKQGPARNSGLDLRFDNTDQKSLGVFKKPIAAGNGSGGLFFDIVPGDHKSSILHYRMASTSPGVAMPEVGRKMIHTEGVELIAEWIKAM